MALTIDAHLHVWQAVQPGVPGAATIVSPHEDVPVERALNVLDANGVDRAVLVQPMFRGEDNNYVADSAAENPRRLAAVCVIDPRVSGAEDRLQYWVSDRGCRGLRLRPRLPEEGAAFGDPFTYPLWECARRLAITMSILASPQHLATLGALAARFPEVPIVLDHLAHPAVAVGVSGPDFQALLGLARHPRVFVKLSGYYYFSGQSDPYVECWDLVSALYDRFGPERLIWGSDFPHVERKTGYARCLALVQEGFPFLSDSGRELILGASAARLYWEGDLAVCRET
jgi:L-fuconolactonase